MLQHIQLCCFICRKRMPAVIETFNKLLSGLVGEMGEPARWWDMNVDTDYKHLIR